MVAYSFQRQFIGPIQRRTKGQTIRAPGKRRHAWVDCQLQLYFAMRTQHCFKIIEDQPCIRVDRVRLNLGLRTVVIGEDGGPLLEGRAELDRFAALDGFESWDELDAFWAKFHPDQRFFDGVMVGWIPGFWA